MSDFEKIEKKVKRSTINDALIAANLGEYSSAQSAQSFENNNRLYNMNESLKYQNYYTTVPMNMMAYNPPIISNNNQNPENVASNMYKIFQRAANEKNPMENNQEPTNINNNPSENTAHQGKKKTRWGPSNPTPIGTKINNLTLNINNNTNININQNPYAGQNANNNNTLMAQQGLKMPFGAQFNNANLMASLAPKNIMNLPIFNPLQNKPIGMKFSTVNNNMPFNNNNNSFYHGQRYNNNNTASFAQRFNTLNSGFPNNNLMNNNTITINSNEDRIRLIIEGVMSPPDSLKDYINRAYQKCLSLAEKNQMDKFLKKIINLSKIHNDIHAKDWKSHPLPTLPRERLEFNKEMNTGNVFSIEEGTSKNTAIDPNEAITILNNGEKGYKGKILNRINRPMIAGNKNMSLKLAKNMKIIQKIKKNNNNFANAQDMDEVSQEEEDKRNQRRARFHKELAAPTFTIKKPVGPGTHITHQDEEDFDFEIFCEKWKIKGICTDLEKSYLRLTSEPDPSQVRPEKVLKNSLKMLLTKWKEGTAKYNYISEQFRSIRQDLIIQHIRNDFTVKVYENNARICLECHDINQFNQCQGKLYELYKDGIKGNKYEFLCYRMIYLILNNQKYETNRLLNELTDEDLKQTNIQISFELQTSMEMGNVKKVFEFYKSAPNLSQYLIDLFINKLRIWGLQILTKGFGEKVNINYLTNLLAFNDPLHCVNFLEETEATLSEDKNWLLSKESHKIFLDHPIMKERSYKAKK